MPASQLTTFRSMAYNNAWANHRLADACAGLDQAAFEAERTGFFPSIQATLNHILIVDRFYVDALEGGTLGPAAWANRIPCPTLADLRPVQSEVDRRLIAFCEALDEAGLDRTAQVHRGTRIQCERTDRLLLHICQHQVHHRGQAHAMLSGTRVKPPQLDEFFVADEAPLRAAEFTELGWTEELVWADDGDPPVRTHGRRPCKALRFRPDPDRNRLCPNAVIRIAASCCSPARAGASGMRP